MTAKRYGRPPSRETQISRDLFSDTAALAFFEEYRNASKLLSEMCEYTNFRVRRFGDARKTLASINVLYYSGSPAAQIPPNHRGDAGGLSEVFASFALKHAPAGTELRDLLRKLLLRWRAQKRCDRLALGQGGAEAAVGP